MLLLFTVASILSGAIVVWQYRDEPSGAARGVALSPPPPSPPAFQLPGLPPTTTPQQPPAPPWAPCGTSDLVVEEAALRNSVYAQWLVNQDPCAVDESCFTGIGERRVLRFSTLIANIGCADYIVGAPALSAGWSWHECHAHWHYINYANYQLQDICLANATIAGHKNGWCVFDAGSYGDHTWPTQRSCDRGSRGCSSTSFVQGISAGCFDVYPAHLRCQWIDITDVPSGTYFLRISTNWDPTTRAASTPESDYSNNEAVVVVELDENRARSLDATAGYAAIARCR